MKWIFAQILELIKNIFSQILRVLKMYVHYNSKYRIKLVIMFVGIFGMFLFVLVYLIQMKIMNNGLETLLLNIDKTSYLNYFVSNKFFKWSTNFLLGHLNFGPSHETLLGLIIVSFSILILLIVLSSYATPFLLPLSLTSCFIFYNLFGILKKSYTVENTAEIFNKFGIKLVKISSDFENSTLLNNFIDENMYLYRDIWILVLEKTKFKYDLSKLDLNELKMEILNKHLLNKEDIITHIKSYMNSHIITTKDATQEALNNITNNTVELTSNSFLTGALLVFLVIGVVIGGVYLYNHINLLGNAVESMQESIKKTETVQNSADAKFTNLSTKVDSHRTDFENLLESTRSGFEKIPDKIPSAEDTGKSLMSMQKQLLDIHAQLASNELNMSDEALEELVKILFEEYRFNGISVKECLELVQQITKNE